MIRVVTNRATPISKSVEKEILKLYGTKKAKELSEIFNVTINQVYEVAKRFRITNVVNQTFAITGLEEQIILSGILGDGRLKKNGCFNYYYSECHALDEKEYCEWKYIELSNTLTKDMNMYGKNLNNNHGDAIEFCTKTTPSLIKYAEMNISDVILRLDQNGLVLYLLDDGCFCKHSKLGNFVISGGVLSHSQLEMLCDRFDYYGITDCHIIGNKKLSISIPSKNNKKIYNIAKNMLGKDIDIFKKKFAYIEKTNQHL